MKLFGWLSIETIIAVMFYCVVIGMGYQSLASDLAQEQKATTAMWKKQERIEQDITKGKVVDATIITKLDNIEKDLDSVLELLEKLRST